MRIQRAYSFGLFLVGFICGGIYLISCGSSAAETTLTAAVITRVSASGNVATCPTNSFVVGGGCRDEATPGICVDAYTQESYPSSTTAWTCIVDCKTGGPAVNRTWALCASTTPADALTSTVSNQ